MGGILDEKELRVQPKIGLAWLGMAGLFLECSRGDDSEAEAWHSSKIV